MKPSSREEQEQEEQEQEEQEECSIFLYFSNNPCRTIIVPCALQSIFFFYLGHNAGVPFDLRVTNVFAIDRFDYLEQVMRQTLKGNHGVPLLHGATGPSVQTSNVNLHSEISA